MHGIADATLRDYAPKGMLNASSVSGVSGGSGGPEGPAPRLRRAKSRMFATRFLAGDIYPPSKSSPTAIHKVQRSAEPKKNIEDQWTYEKTVRFIIGIIFILFRAFGAILGMGGNPSGSAIRQSVFSQWTTNGLLAMIFGLILARK